MNVDLRIPRRGDRISAASQAQILAEIRANRILQSPGVRVMRGPNGTHIAVDVPKRAAAPAADKGCWRIVSQSIEVETGGETVAATVHFIDRQYYQVGGMLFEGTDQTTLESFVEAGTPFIAAKVLATGSGSHASLVGYADFAAMKADSLDRTFSLIPLYELELPEEEEGESEGEAAFAPVSVVVKTDFRSIPLVQAFELPLEGGIA